MHLYNSHQWKHETLLLPTDSTTSCVIIYNLLCNVSKWQNPWSSKQHRVAINPRWMTAKHCLLDNMGSAIMIHYTSWIDAQTYLPQQHILYTRICHALHHMFQKQQLTAKWLRCTIPHIVVDAILCRVVTLHCEVYQYWQQVDHAVQFPLAPYRPSSRIHASTQPQIVLLVGHQQCQYHPTEISTDPSRHQYAHVSHQCCQILCNIMCSLVQISNYCWCIIPIITVSCTQCNII